MTGINADAGLFESAAGVNDSRAVVIEHEIGIGFDGGNTIILKILDYIIRDKSLAPQGCNKFHRSLIVRVRKKLQTV